METVSGSWLPNNQYFLTTFYLLVIGGISGSLYLLLKQAVDIFLRTFIITVTLDNKSDAFDWLVRWLGELEEQKAIRDATEKSLTQKAFRWFSFFSDLLYSSSTSAHTNTLTLKITRPNARKTFWGSVIDEDEGQIEFLPGPGNHVFKYKGKMIWLNRYASDKVTVQGWDRKPFIYETLTLTSYGRDQKIFQQLFMDAQKMTQKKDSNRTKIYVLDEYGYGWQLALAKHPRKFESVVLDTDLAERIYLDAKEFLNSKDFYMSRGLPWRRGYLLFGAPGCGKTSFTQALAARLELNICVLTLSSNTLDDQRLTTRLHDCPAKSIILLEDVDCVFVERNTADNNHDVGSRVTFSGLLNAIDGVASQEGRIFFMTTNHIDKLDPALQRPGRCDVKVEFKLASKIQLYNMFCRFYEEEKDQEFVKQCAKQFSNTVPEHTVSMASLQEHLMRHKGDPESALNHCNHLLEDVDEMDKENTSTVYVAEWLRRLGIAQYTQIFHQRMVYTLKDMADIDEHSLQNEFKIEPYGHRDMILGMLKGRKDLMTDFEFATVPVMKKILMEKYGRDVLIDEFVSKVPFDSVSIAQVKNHVRTYSTIREALDKIDELLHPCTKLVKDEEVREIHIDTRTWLQSLGLEQYAEKFIENEIIDQDDIIQLNDSDMKDIGGVEKKGHIMKIMASIEKMKKQVEKRKKLLQKINNEDE
jgi:chaperone BCS1